MIYLFAGDDTKKKILNYEKFLESLNNDIEFFFINKKDFIYDQIESFYSGEGLFFSECVIVFSNILEKEEILDFVIEKLKFFSESKNIFVFVENKLDKKTIDSFKKARAELNIFELPKEKKEKFNNFLLANAFGDRDKLNLWIYYRLAIDKGVGMEELIGVLHWKIKDMILKKNFRKYSKIELQNIDNKLSYLLPEARKEGYDAEIVFEKFLLEIF